MIFHSFLYVYQRVPAIIWYCCWVWTWKWGKRMEWGSIFSDKATWWLNTFANETYHETCLNLRGYLIKSNQTWQMLCFFSVDRWEILHQLLTIGHYETLLMVEGSLEVKLPTIWRDERAVSREKSQKRKIRRKKMQAREKVGKSRNTVFFRGFVAPEGWKVGSQKRRVRRHLGRWEMKSGTPLWREAHLEVKCVKNWGVRSDHFWKLRCWKSARRCGAKHISKSKCTKHTSPGPLLEVKMSKKCTPLSKCTKHTSSGPLLEVEMSKKCTPLWREAHFEVKMYKTHQPRTTFGS